MTKFGSLMLGPAPSSLRFDEATPPNDAHVHAEAAALASQLVRRRAHDDQDAAMLLDALGLAVAS